MNLHRVRRVSSRARRTWLWGRGDKKGKTHVHPPLWPRVVLLSNRYPHAINPQSGWFVERHVALQRQAGWRITVLAPDGGHSLWQRWLAYGRVVAQAGRMLLTGRFDLVHAHYPFPAGLIGLVLSWVWRKPLVVTSHGYYVSNAAQVGGLARWATRLVLRRADRIIAVSSSHKEELLAVVGRSLTDRIECIDMGVWLPPRIPTRNEARAALGVPAETRLIVFIGYLIQRKGVDLLLMAAAALQEKGYDFQLVVGGSGVEETPLRRQAVRSGVADRVQFLGLTPHAEVYAWFTAADIAVVPSRAEPFGLTVLEAMACGAAVVAADVGGLQQTVQAGYNGLLFAVEDVAGLTAALERLLQEPETRQQLAAAGRLTAAEYDLRRKATAVATIYQRLLQWEDDPDIAPSAAGANQHTT